MKRQAKKTGGEPVTPPLIEHDPPHKLAGHVQLGVAQARRWGAALNRLARRPAYRLSLVGLIGLTLGFLALALLQVGNIKPPDWRALLDGGQQLLSGLPASRPERLRETPPSETEFGTKLEATKLETELEVAPVEATPVPSVAQPQGSVAAPGQDTKLPAPQREGTAITTPDQPLDQIPDQPLDLPAAHRQIADLQTTLAETRRRLAQTEQQLLERADVPARVPDAAQLARLTARAALADLLLRLHSGWPFDDLLDSGTLAQLLRPDEMSLLALYARRGLPTWASLLAQAETLPLIAGASSTGSAGPALPVALAWLADKAPGLVNLRPAPLAGAPGHYRDLHRHISQRDLAAAGQSLRRLMVMTDEAMRKAPANNNDNNNDNSNSNSNSNGAALGDALHALYADMQAVGKTDTLMRSLRADYLSGARP